MHSRAASPALSLKSKRSTMSARQRTSYVAPDLTDDEDSEEELAREDLARGNRRRTRRNSENVAYDDGETLNRIQRMKEKSRLIRERRSGSLTHWPSSKNKESDSFSNSDHEIAKIDKMSLDSPILSRKHDDRRLHKGSPVLDRKHYKDSGSGKSDERNDSRKIASPASNKKHIPSDSDEDNQTKRSPPPEKIKSPIMQKKKSIEKEISPIMQRKKLNSDSDKEPAGRKTPLSPVSNRKKLNYEPEKAPLSPIAGRKKISSESSVEIQKKSIKSPILSRKIPEKKQNGKLEKSLSPVRKSVSSESSSIDTPPSKVLQKEVSTPIKEVKKEIVKEKSPSPELILDKDWECEHCTFVNEPNSKICVICCKTRTAVLKKLPKEDEVEIDVEKLMNTDPPKAADAPEDTSAKKKGRTKKITFLPGTKAH